MVAHVYTPLSELLDAADLPAHLFLPDAADLLPRIFVLRHGLVQTLLGAQLEAAIEVEHELAFGFPLLPLQLVVGPTAADTPAVVRWRLEDAWAFEVDDLPIALRLSPTFLRPIEDGHAFAEIVAHSGVRLEAGTLRHGNPGQIFTLPPAQIPGLGIIVSLENILFDFSETESPPEILALGFDASFRGMYAASGALSILPMMQRPNGGRGITIQAQNLAVRSEGVTGELSAQLFVERLHGTIGENSEAFANLFSPEWQIALEEVSLSLRDNALQSFGAAGVLNVPFLDSLLALSLTARHRAEGPGLIYDASIAAEEPGTISTPLGAVAYQTLALTGHIDDDAFAASGTVTGLAVETEGFPISAASAAVSVRRGDGPLGLSLRVQDLQLGDWGKIAVAEITIGERRPDGRVAHRLIFGIDTPLPLGTTGLVLEQGMLTLEVTTGTDGVGDWRELLGNATIDLTGLRLTGPALPGGELAGDLRVVFRDDVLQLDESHLRRKGARGQAPALLGIKRLHLSRECVAVEFSDPQINYWFHQLAPDLADGSEPAVHDISLRVVLGTPIQELRLDWDIQGNARVVKLPGLEVLLPPAVRLSVLLGAAGRPFTNLAIALTFPAGSQLTAISKLSWLRGGDREIHSGEAEQPFLELRALAERRATLVLLDWDTQAGGLPQFFRQLPSPMPELDWSTPASLAQLTAYQPVSLSSEDWDLAVRVNLETLPFLRGGGGATSQFLRIAPERTSVDVQLAEHLIRVDLGLDVNIGELLLETAVPMQFDWESFAFQIPHDFGLALIIDEEVLEPAEQHLGLSWRFKGAPARDADGDVIPGRFHLLTLATQNHNYSILQAPGAVFEVEYTQLSSEGIGFSIEDFALTPKGISLAATVIDRPAKMNGLDTRFRFADSQLVIVENQITEFTLKGTGPLPPALVGDATADVTLQMAQRDGRLTLVSGGAQLKGSKLLDCKGTRFQFSVTAIGLSFVYEERFHLYFKLTGSARFKLGAGDDREGALAWLPDIQIDLVDCPLTGDASVLAKHVQFLIELPRPKSFSFLGAFEMELRAIGFVPQAEVFDGDGAMLISGQLKFAQGPGDAADSRSDFHKLYIGLPKKGSFIPRIHFTELPVHLNFGSAFRLNGTVEFVDGALEKGFTGEGSLEISGLPTIATAFGFLRVRRDADAPWVRAWFIYAELRKISVQIPVVPIFLREVGLGFGYRYTLVSIRAADQANDVGKLLKELTALSRTQGDLSKRDRWAVDLEEAGQDPRWTVAFRALLSQTTASASPLSYDENAEKVVPCLFLLDAVVALRSDLTFLMAARGWLFTNYYDYVSNYKGLREKPVVSGFVLLSPRKKRFLTHVATNPGGQLGAHPPMPDFVQRALANSQFSATLLVEPGLLHTELGWPNQLRWADKLGPLAAEFRGGFIFRVSRDELVTGISYLARASLDVGAELSLGIVGVAVRAEVRVSYGARFIGLLSLRDPLNSSAIYGGVGLEVLIRFSVELWIKIKIFRIKITKTWRFSFMLNFTASLELGIVGVSPSGVGLRGSGHLSVSVMGHNFAIGVNLGINAGAVQTALDRTRHVLNLGLDAAEVEAIPGTTGTGSPLRRQAAAPRKLAVAPPRPLDGTFQLPGYTAFVVRGATEAEPSYFVLMPAGERSDGTAETGFLPVPPQTGAAVTSDFHLAIPGGGAAYTLEQFNPITRAWVSRPATGAGDRAFSWAVDWGAMIAEGEQQTPGGDADEAPTPRSFVLRDYLRNAFIVTETEVPGDPDADPIITPVRDPAPLPGAELVEDGRVHNPTEAAFEAAVRGAMEQFRGSPYFRRDPSSEYDQLLERAFHDGTSIYSETGLLDAATAEDALGEQQAHQLRGMVIHDLVSDLRDYAAAARGVTPAPAPDADSIAFAMGLVFRVSGPLPAWLSDAVGSSGPAISQRRAPDAAAPDAATAGVRTFNVRSADFAANPPRFERVQQLSDASTIALAWDLVWPTPPAGELTPAQRDPEHHLLNYQVRRRPLDGNDREVVLTVKGGDPLHREAGGVMKQLRRRFQLVDHFDETPEDLALLPINGKSYLYSITPIDFSGNAGRPLSIVATRFPSDPPMVPVDGEATVHYVVDDTTLDPIAAVPATQAPPLLTPEAFTVTWSEIAGGKGPTIPIGTYQLVLRRESTLPIGSYGLDSTTSRPSETSLPTSNARPMPTDAKLVIFPEGPSDARTATVTLQELRDAGVFPPAGEKWRPEAWRVFFQTISLNGVPSALAPVKLRLQITPDATVAVDTLVPLEERREERRPAELEWLPQPMRFPILPPEDELATVGALHVPMPSPGDGASAMVFDPALANLRHRVHPEGLRCVRFRWNQGPSGEAGYPLDLNAGYRILELDVDALTTETFGDRARLAEALRPIQEVQMIPANELALVPGDTLAPAQWEAWYPSALSRQRPAAERAEGSELAIAPWHSWRESILEWPTWPGLTGAAEAGVRDGAHHPSLRAIADALAADHHVELQAPPAMQPQDLAAFLKATAPAADPYGWGILQRFGLSMAFRLRSLATGEILTGAALLAAVQGALITLDEVAARHLHVELLFQPGRTIELEERGAEASGLLALIQLSLRPAFRQVRSYGRVSLEGRPGDLVELAITLAPGTSCSIVDQGNPGAGQIELAAEPGQSVAFRRTIPLPLGGRTTLLVRGFGLPAVARVGAGGATTPLPLEPFAATDERVSYFTIDATALAAELAGAEPIAARSWTAFRRYAESLSSNDPAISDAEKIRVPAAKDQIAPLAPDVLGWMQRFFDHGVGLAKPAGRAWVATAYPRAGSPAHAAPDAAGRLQYDHRIEDPWAHTYRYYVRPYGRYDLLWQGLRQSPLLFPETPRFEETTPETSGGGLDVVLDRTRAVAKPIVLSSRRLDPPSTPASPAAPGATWEVIVAEHPEQTLVAHNQTLARQLAFRQISYTLLRELAFPSWLTHLGVAVAPVAERYPLLPSALPAAAEHLDLTVPLDEADARTLDLPTRLGPFQQGAMALQWEGLPFYYQHRLMLVAQTSRVVSPVNEVMQRDFEYRTPDPISDMEVAAFSWTPPPPFSGGALALRGRVMNVQLRQLWDSLPAAAQARWPSDQPDGVHRTPGWLPDLGVVYQLVELFSGNVEVQAEIYFDEELGAFARRQLGKRFLADVNALTAPQDAGTYSLAVSIQQIAQQQLSRSYTAAQLAAIPAATRSKLVVDGRTLSFVGVMTHADLARLEAVFDVADHPSVRALHDAWASQVPVSETVAIPPALADAVDFATPTQLRLVWDGAMNADEKAALLALPGDLEFKAALARLAETVGEGTGVVAINAPLGPEPIPPPLAARASLARNPSGLAYSALRWIGNLSDDDAEALKRWPRILDLASAVAALTEIANQRSHTLPLPPARPLPAELPPLLRDRLALTADQLGWSAPAPTDAERATLLALAGDAAFLDARDRLLTALDAERSAALAAVVTRPTQQSLPPTLAQLQLGADALAWADVVPTAEQRAALLALPGDRAFRDAVRALLAALDAGASPSVPLSAFVPRPAQTELPEPLRTRLVIEAAALRFTSPAPSDAERLALTELVADDAMNEARDVLLTLIDADRLVALAPQPPRPRQGDLPPALAAQLTLAPTSLTWTGRVRDAATRAALLALPGDPPLAAALAALLAQLDTQLLEAPLLVEVRPAAAELGALGDKLILGRAELRFHGLMLPSEIAALAALFTRAADRRAVARLYGVTQQAGMRGRQLQLRARRGAAPPSQLHPIPPKAS